MTVYRSDKNRISKQYQQLRRIFFIRKRTGLFLCIFLFLCFCCFCGIFYFITPQLFFDDNRNVDNFVIVKIPQQNNNNNNKYFNEVSNKRKEDNKEKQIKEEKTLWDRAATQKYILQTHFKGETPETATFNNSLRNKLKEIPQCRALGESFLDYLFHYLFYHYYNDNNNDNNNETLQYNVKRIIYSCESHKKHYLCGGMGDRFRGIITTFWLAILSRRRFEIYHPSPVPIQKFLPPYLVNYIPSLSVNISDLDINNNNNDNNNNGVCGLKHFRESLSPFISKAPVDFRLMNIDRHKEYLLKQKKANEWISQQNKKPIEGSKEWWLPQYIISDIRIQSNSPGIDKFLYKDKELYDIKTQLLKLANCNISCYYGCLSHILFQPDERLWNAASKVLQNSQNNNLIQLINKLQKPKPGDVFPFVSLQVRMGGTWATGLHIPESFRTFPWALQHYYLMTREILSGDAWRRYPELFPTNYPLKYIFNNSNHNNNNNSIVLFISSDSSKFIEEAKNIFKDMMYVHIINVDGDSFQHTDTLNIADLKGKKCNVIEESIRDNAYFLTLLNHYLLSISSHSIMAQSGFSETAFWRSRQVASSIIIDISSQKAWQNHQRYWDNCENLTTLHSAMAIRNRILNNLHALPTPFYS